MLSYSIKKRITVDLQKYRDAIPVNEILELTEKYTSFEWGGISEGSNGKWIWILELEEIGLVDRELDLLEKALNMYCAKIRLDQEKRSKKK